MFDRTKLEKLNKADLMSELETLASDDISLDSINTDMTKKAMLAAAETLFSTPTPNADVPADTPADTTEPLDIEAKKEAMKDMIETQSEAVLFPSGQSFYRLRHGDRTFTIGPAPFSESALKEVPISKLRPGLREPDEDISVRRFRPTIIGTNITTVPEWAYTEVYDYIQKGTLLLFETEEELQSTVGAMYQQSKRGSLIVDEAVKPTIQLTKAREMSLNDDYAPVILKPGLDFTRPEQEAAWRVINEVVEGEEALPARDEQDADPKHITTAEIQHVRSRIDRCIKYPEGYLKDTQLKGPFSLQVFLNQLLEIEYSGFTPARPGVESKIGGTRPSIIRLLREVAKSKGFEVLGDYVVKSNLSGEIEAKPQQAHSLMPSINL